MIHRCDLAVIFWICLLPLISFGQINIKAGYNISIPSSDSLNLILADKNQLTGYSDPFSKIQWLHGLEAGIRLKGDIHALELSYQGAYQALKSGYETGGESYHDKIRNAIHAIAIGYQVSEGLFGIGVDYQYQFHRIRFENGLTGMSFTDVQNISALKPYLMLNLEGGGTVDMAIQPYAVFPFKSFDYTALQDHLGTDVIAPPEKWIRWGISVLFYNGQ